MGLANEGRAARRFDLAHVLGLVFSARKGQSTFRTSSAQLVVTLNTATLQTGIVRNVFEDLAQLLTTGLANTLYIFAQPVNILLMKLVNMYTGLLSKAAKSGPKLQLNSKVRC